MAEPVAVCLVGAGPWAKMAHAPMLTGGPETAALARDTVFAAVMIILTGIVGLCLLIGGMLYKEQVFKLHGANVSLSTLAAIVVLTLILPNYTLTTTGPIYSHSQLAFIALVSLSANAW